MNRFEYAESRFMPNEVYVRRDMIVRLYDGDIKVISPLMLLVVEKIDFARSDFETSVCVCVCYV